MGEPRAGTAHKALSASCDETDFEWPRPLTHFRTNLVRSSQTQIQKGGNMSKGNSAGYPSGNHGKPSGGGRDNGPRGK
jgi:hypothetical protein